MNGFNEISIVDNIPYIFFMWKLWSERSKIKYVVLSFINVILNTLLKISIKEERPLPTIKYGKYQQYGMPSGHSMFVWFSLLYNFKFNFTHIFFLFLALLSNLQRITTRLHSKKQVMVGSILGSIYGIITTYL